MAEKATMPLDVLGDGANRKFDAVIEIKWGGLGGQADAIKLAFARALLEWDNSVRATLKPYWLLKRDPRVKERKKFGRLKARKAPHRSKR
jgi:small subunit ribosomal protein S9